MNKSVKKRLLYFFCRNGYLRSPNKARRKRDGQYYRKGYEIRFVVNNKEELSEMRALLKKAGFKAGKPYSKHSRFVFPVYGREYYEKFQKYICD
jgi:hypothetical protein